MHVIPGPYDSVVCNHLFTLAKWLWITTLDYSHPNTDLQDFVAHHYFLVSYVEIY